MALNRHEFPAMECNLYVASGYCNACPLRHVSVEMLSVLIYMKMSMSTELRRESVEFNLKEYDYSFLTSSCKINHKDYKTSNCFPIRT